ncbi:MAG: hypothetical protein ACPG52_06095 [Cognaticolwellia sp.]
MNKQNIIVLLFTAMLGLVAHNTYAKADITDVVTKEEFISYQDVAEFIDNSPKVTIVVPAQQSDVDEYGQGVVKTLTGSDCDRDGKMDDNQTCNAVYYKLWLKYRLNNKDNK